MTTLYYNDRPRSWYRFEPSASKYGATAAKSKGMFHAWQEGSLTTAQFDERTPDGFGLDALELREQYQNRGPVSELRQAHNGSSQGGFGPSGGSGTSSEGPPAAAKPSSSQSDASDNSPKDCPPGKEPERIKVAGGFATVCRDKDRPEKVLSAGYVANGTPLSEMAPDQVDDVVGAGAGGIGVPESYAERYGVEESDDNNWTLLSKLQDATEASSRKVSIEKAIDIARRRGLDSKLSTLQSLQRGQGAVISVSESSMTIPGGLAQQSVEPDPPPEPPDPPTSSKSSGGNETSPPPSNSEPSGSPQNSQPDSPASPSSGIVEDTASGSQSSTTDNSSGDGLSKRAILAGLGAGAIIYGVSK